jgi:5-methyltetrahydropteroyltriglutamate--homocysteine methyltransferase
MKTFVTGFPRIGEQRELKFALERFWKGEETFTEVQNVASALKKRHWNYQKKANIDAISINDFSLYDNTLDTMIALGLEPKSHQDISDETARYFAISRGDAEHRALEMTKWFNTNYHYIVPILDETTDKAVNITKIKAEYTAAKAQGITPKVNLIGPLTFIANAKKSNGEDAPFELFEQVLVKYKALITEIATLDDQVLIQIDEPVFVTDKVSELGLLIKKTYSELTAVASNVEIFVITYFDHACEATKALCTTDIAGIGLDFVYGEENKEVVKTIADAGKKLIAGVIDGRNIWISDIDAKVTLLKALTKEINKENIIVGTSCSLLHVPFTLRYEEKLDPEVRSWLAYAVEKLDELNLTAKCFFNDTLSEREVKMLEANRTANQSRKTSSKIHDEAVQARMKELESLKVKRVPYEERIIKQHERFGYPELATTTIGSFPQTPEVRKSRRAFKNGEIEEATYIEQMKTFTKECVLWQDEIGLDVLVHGEFERNDMVEYFGEQLSGVAFSQNGWVQSYGSRCVKPPLIYGDVSRPEPMTVFWSSYAQSLTAKPMKGMLTGAVTILNWSFVRDDQPRSETCYQISLGIRDEIDDLQNAGIEMIQVDEAAFKEGYPLRASKRPAYEDFAVKSFWISTNVANESTQIHTHMCYSEFNDIIRTIEDMDADVISIETARSGNVLLKVFQRTGYLQEIGPGVYDIHSPRVPAVEEMVEQIKALLDVLPAKQLWINPDCGLKTRGWAEAKPSLENMVKAVKEVRATL